MSISASPFCFCWNRPAIRHLADSMVLTMLVERTLKMEEKWVVGGSELKNSKTFVLITLVLLP